MNALILSRAQENKYATFSLAALYDRSKDGVPFDVVAFMTSATPYGPVISLDGVHPNAAGHAILASAAQEGIMATYKYKLWK